MRDRVTVLAPAKLNLALDVVGILPGGYHALDMTMQAISLYERVVIRRTKTEFEVVPVSDWVAEDDLAPAQAEMDLPERRGDTL